MFVVYVALCVSTEKLYFGLTSKTLKRRRREHLTASAKPRMRFHAALAKHGADDFVWYEIGCVPTKEDACQLERALIAYFCTTDYTRGYNVSAGGQFVVLTPEALKRRASRFKGRALSEEHRAKLRAAWRNRGPVSEVTRQKMRAAMLGKKMPLSDDARQRIAAANKGRKRSTETRARMSAAKSGKPRPDHVKAKIRATLLARGPRGPRSEATKRKISETLKNRIKSRENV